jgi:hypothetical protein
VPAINIELIVELVDDAQLCLVLFATNLNLKGGLTNIPNWDSQ